MKTFSICLLTCLFNLCCVAQDEVLTKFVQEGIALHDKGAYDAAIQKYDSALAVNKDDYDANYEKSISCLYAKRYEDCIAISKYLLEKYPNSKETRGVYSNYGSALDDKGDAEAAIRIFDKGIAVYPKDYLLVFNKGLTLTRAKKEADALRTFFIALKNKPDHPGSLYYTAFLQEKSNKVAALISSLVFLAAEPEGERAKTIYAYMNQLMGFFATKGANGSNTITISAGELDNKKKENNFSLVTMMLGLGMAGDVSKEQKETDEVQQLSTYIQMLITGFSTGVGDGKGLYWKIYVPFLTEMKKKELVPVFAHIAAITSGNEKNIQWINDNQDKLKEFYDWMGAYKWDNGQ